MHLIECIAVGGFKINGPPKNGKGPMSNEKELESSNEASLPQPTQAGRTKPCTELIKQARRCLGNGDKDCVTRLIEELIKADCHNGYAVGREIADKVKGVFHELWLVSDNERKCELLMILRDLDVSRNWVRSIFNTNTKMLNRWLRRCGISWEDRAARSDVVKEIENLLRERFGWSEARMCEELWRFVGVDVNEFRRHGIEPCIWLIGLERLRSLKRPYWLGLRASDLAVNKHAKCIVLKLKTTNTIDAVFFPMILNTIKTPNLDIVLGRKAPAARYVTKSIALLFYVDLGIDEWPWPIKLSANELEKILNSLSDEGLAMFVAGMIDGDGLVRCIFKDNNAYVHVGITACKKCHKSYILNALRNVITERFGIVGRIEPRETANVLVFRGRNAVRLLRLIRPFVHHPLRRLRAELILALYDGRISRETFEKLYKTTEYEYGGPDVKRNNALEALTRAAPQTHTHGDVNPSTNIQTPFIRNLGS
jgi:hypothetical protein